MKDGLTGPSTGSYRCQRISRIDQWFRVDMTSRLLNDPIDVSAAPNQHADPSTNTLNSYFQAVFDNDVTGDGGDLSTWGPAPWAIPAWRCAVSRSPSPSRKSPCVKEVCNESLHGTGPTCSHFVPLADDGDAYNSYIYRLTLTNEASSGGVQRAPAYDVTVTDRLDASDLAYVLPFDADGLDNDGDGAIDEADEGVISDNIVRNGTAAVITFAYTHSSPLLRINPGDSRSNCTTASITTMTRHRCRPSPTRPTPPMTVSKGYPGIRVRRRDRTAISVVRDSTPPSRARPQCGSFRWRRSPSGSRLCRTRPCGGSATQGVSIGEEIHYRLNTLLPVALLRNFVIRDELPAGLRLQ